jgi:hypothetical protein
VAFALDFSERHSRHTSSAMTIKHMAAKHIVSREKPDMTLCSEVVSRSPI